MTDDTSTVLSFSRRSGVERGVLGEGLSVGEETTEAEDEEETKEEDEEEEDEEKEDDECRPWRRSNTVVVRARDAC